MMTLDFEEPIIEIEKQISSLKERDSSDQYAEEIAQLQQTRDRVIQKTYASLSPWQTVRVARHPERPQTVDYVRMICRDFCELHGDRHFGDDPAILCGFARIGAMKVLVVGHNKGRTTAEKIACHFGCAHPEGYRKALTKMRLAEKFGLPIVTFVDTPGAYPGLGSEQRGQAEAVAMNLREMSRLRTPIVSIVIGEGGSGGALGIGVGDRVAMLEHAWYSVISPEGCAAILWKEANEKTNELAARSLCLTARDNLSNGLIDDILDEPVGGSHRDPAGSARTIETWVIDQLGELARLNPETLIRRRFDKFRKIGAVTSRALPAPTES
ncbi:MAG: acetyl-CoA carboxylase carboxyltransferase subunit alpha [Planctomycetota bacterium]|nr:acetyl-CoA carboxylase carboxyltransferase subunit alpha [Planctomycetota bacterium]MEC9156881.1 acetyl-CoA carboxylase carboxyltransferase subunit alpha [Planctomycetota bacterium]MED5508182.1 acetyl-CoA carboxylase carboxyltransferase subunit alpha [Planctomycetota bacterium]